MKNVVIATADLHVGHTAIEDVVEMAREIDELVHREGLRVLALLVLGDAGESLRDIEMTLVALGDLAAVRVYVPGNHDLFDTERMGSSLRRYRDLLPALAERNGYAWGVREKPFLVGDIVIVTTTAWPRPETIIAEVDLDRGDVLAAREDLPDARWITRDLRHDVVSNEQLHLFMQALSAVPRDVRKAIVATHYPVLLQQNSKPVSAYTPWFISPRFGDNLLQWKNERPNIVVEVVSGHLHEHVDVMTHGVRARVIDSGYRRPGYVVVEV